MHLNTGRAFVEFETVEDAEKAICHMDGVSVLSCDPIGAAAYVSVFIYRVSWMVK